MGGGGDERGSRVMGMVMVMVMVMVIVIVMSMIIVMSMVMGSMSREVHLRGRGSMAMTSSRTGPKEDVDAGRLL
jgi:hypothetical protein